jgi:diacylglycerol kinase (ATP)
VREVDLWAVNGIAFMQLAGVGFDAAVIRETTWEAKKKFGPLSYLMSGWKVLGHPAVTMSVRAEGHDPVSGTVVLLGNGRQYGGPFSVFPGAVAGDGLLDVVVMPNHGWRAFFAMGRALISGRYDSAHGVHYFQTPRLRVEAKEKVPFEVDGELAGAAEVLDFSWQGKLSVMAPVPVEE